MRDEKTVEILGNHKSDSLRKETDVFIKKFRMAMGAAVFFSLGYLASKWANLGLEFMSWGDASSLIISTVFLIISWIKPEFFIGLDK